MFNLEQSIAEWRKQMLAAGIKSPVPLEELENHLRDEIERQVETGIDAQQAFEMTVSQIGDGAQLKKEFSKTAGPFGFLGNDKFTRVDRILGALWLVLSLRGFINVCFAVGSLPHPHSPAETMTFVLVCLSLLAFFGVGLLGGVLLLASAKGGRNIIRILALFSLILSIPSLAFNSFSVEWGIFRLFDLATVWFLFSKSFARPTASVK
jgi:hypothetical protein